MNKDTSASQVGVARAPITLLMVLCGIVSAGAAGAVSAATVSGDTPTLVVHYSADALSTDSGTRALYRRLENAAVQVCPAEFTGSRLVNSAVLHCREQAIARAVHNIGNSRLAALYSSATKRG